MLRRTALLSAAALVVTWSSGFIGAELGSRAGAVPVTLLGWRFAILAVLLLVVTRVLRRPLPPLAAWRRHAVLGLLCQAVYLILVFEGVSRGVPGGTAALIAALQPLLVATVAGPLLGERTNAPMWAGMVLGLVGVAVVVSGDLGVSGAPWWTFLLPTVGMLSLASGTVLTRRIAPPEDVLDTMLLQSTVTAVVLAVAAAATGQVAPPADAGFWFAVLWLIVLASLGGYGMYVVVTRESGATVVSTLLFLTPPTTMLWVWLMFGDPPTAVGLAGLAISAVGVLVVLRSRPRVAAA